MNLNPFVDLIVTVLGLYAWVVLIEIVIHWLLYFNVINRYHPIVSRLSEILFRLTNPVFSRVRKIIPPISGLDLSPILVFIFIRFLINVCNTYFYVNQ